MSEHQNNSWKETVWLYPSIKIRSTTIGMEAVFVSHQLFLENPSVELSNMYIGVTLLHLQITCDVWFSGNRRQRMH